ncbi:MAG: hypothetical protein DRJ42_00410 [Deltaproteobacteria bacterium]|nr:MAG: hypothetical protein DRJ42_00410 [Deltaproteobacteria bacterium]
MLTALLLLSSSVMLGACGGATPDANEPLRGAGAQHELSTDDPIAQALAARLTIWVSRDGEPTYARHCRNAPGGCEARIATLAELLEDAADRHGLDPWLFAAVAVRESMLNPAAIGAQGEAGIVQLHPRGAGHDMRYVQDASYREACQSRVDACQGPVVERGAQHLADAIEGCGGTRAGLGKYASGRCGAAATYVERMMAERDRLESSQR